MEVWSAENLERLVRAVREEVDRCKTQAEMADEEAAFQFVKEAFGTFRELAFFVSNGFPVGGVVLPDAIYDIRQDVGFIVTRCWVNINSDDPNWNMTTEKKVDFVITFLESLVTKVIAKYDELLIELSSQETGEGTIIDGNTVKKNGNLVSATKRRDHFKTTHFQCLDDYDLCAKRYSDKRVMLVFCHILLCSAILQQLGHGIGSVIPFAPARTVLQTVQSPRDSGADQGDSSG